MKDHDEYRPTSARRRLLIVLLAVTTAVTVMLTLLYPPAGAQRMHPPATPDAAVCSEGNASLCVGGKADVILVPAQAASAANR